MGRIGVSITCNHLEKPILLPPASIGNFLLVPMGSMWGSCWRCWGLARWVLLLISKHQHSQFSFLFFTVSYGKSHGVPALPQDPPCCHRCSVKPFLTLQDNSQKFSWVLNTGFDLEFPPDFGNKHDALHKGSSQFLSLKILSPVLCAVFSENAWNLSGLWKDIWGEKSVTILQNARIWSVACKLLYWSFLYLIVAVCFWERHWFW